MQDIQELSAEAFQLGEADPGGRSKMGISLAQLGMGKGVQGDGHQEQHMPRPPEQEDQAAMQLGLQSG